jgi:hypothetical protein
MRDRASDGDRISRSRCARDSVRRLRPARLDAGHELAGHPLSPWRGRAGAGWAPADADRRRGRDPLHTGGSPGRRRLPAGAGGFVLDRRASRGGDGGAAAGDGRVSWRRLAHLPHRPLPRRLRHLAPGARASAEVWRARRSLRRDRAARHGHVRSTKPSDRLRCRSIRVFVAAQLRGTPAWLFHGADDTVILPSESQTMFAALRAAGADVRYTEYAGVGHNSWERAYGEKELWRWLFRQRLPSTSAPDRPAPAPPPPPAR